MQKINIFFCSFALVFLGVFLSISASAQRFGFIDSQKVMESVPSYKQNMLKLDSLVVKWKGTIAEEKRLLDSVQTDYKANELLYTDKIRKAKLEELEKRKKSFSDVQNRFFGYEGLYFLKREEFTKPLQDQIYKAVEEVCRKKRLNFMYDIASDYGVLYAHPRHDYSDYVLEELGYGDPADRIK